MADRVAGVFSPCELLWGYDTGTWAGDVVILSNKNPRQTVLTEYFRCVKRRLHEP